MRKALLSFAFLLLGVASVTAGARRGGTPENQNGSASIDPVYFGVDIATTGNNNSGVAALSLTTATVGLFRGEGVLVGFVASSNTAQSDYIIFRETGSVTPNVDNLVDNEICRVYLASNTLTTASSLAGSQMGVTYKFPAPIHVRSGVTARAVTAVTTGLNSIVYLYHKYSAGD